MITTLIQWFAGRYRVRLRQDPGDGSAVVRGRAGLVYDSEDGSLLLMFVPVTADGCAYPRPRSKGRTRAWTNAKVACLAVGMELVQDGDDEGTLRFDPRDSRHADLAIQITRIKRRRVLSAEEAAVRRTRLNTIRAR